MTIYQGGRHLEIRDSITKFWFMYVKFYFTRLLPMFLDFSLSTSSCVALE